MKYSKKINIVKFVLKFLLYTVIFLIVFCLGYRYGSRGATPLTWQEIYNDLFFFVFLSIISAIILCIWEYYFTEQDEDKKDEKPNKK